MHLMHGYEVNHYRTLFLSATLIRMPADNNDLELLGRRKNPVFARLGFMLDSRGEMP